MLIAKDLSYSDSNKLINESLKRYAFPKARMSGAQGEDMRGSAFWEAAA